MRSKLSITFREKKRHLTRERQERIVLDLIQVMEEGQGRSPFCSEKRGSELKRGLKSAITTVENEREMTREIEKDCQAALRVPLKLETINLVNSVIYTGTNLCGFLAVLSNRR